MSPDPLHAFIGLGSNLGNRLQALNSAFARLTGSEDVELVSASSVYECPPWGYESNNNYLNAVVEIHWNGPPLKLQEFCYKIETLGGRHRAGANPPRYYKDRTIDLDLICIDGIEVDDPRLILPHPLAHHRGFVLVPLMEIAPDLVIRGRTVEEWLSDLDSAEIDAITPSGRLEGR